MIINRLLEGQALGFLTGVDAGGRACKTSFALGKDLREQHPAWS